jgi:tetratricopeptide (TPR) repeat protein
MSLDGQPTACKARLCEAPRSEAEWAESLHAPVARETWPRGAVKYRPPFSGLFQNLMLSLGAMTSSASSIDDLLKQGIAAARKGRKTEARDKLLLVVELDEQNEQAWLWLSGVVASDSDRRVCLENVLALNPASTAAQKGLRWLDEHAPASRRECCPHCQAELPSTGNVCPTCHQPVLISCPQCHEYMEIVLHRCPQCGTTLGDYHDHNPYYLNLAEAYADRNNFPLANWALEQVISAQPDTAELRRCGAVYQRLDRPTRSIDLCRQAIERDPRQAAAYLQLGALYRQLELPDEMREVYQSGLRQLPGEPTLLLAWGQGLSEVDGADHEAIEVLRRAVKHQPGSIEAHLLLGQLYNRQEDSMSALAHYRQVLINAAPDAASAIEARRASATLQRTLADGWGEFTRHLLGFMLCPICAALSNAQLSPLKIGWAPWLLLGLALIASFIWISSADMPRNPLTVKLFGADEALRLHAPFWNGIGKFLWAFAFTALVLRM